MQSSCYTICANPRRNTPHDANIIIATSPSRINQNRSRFFAEAKSKGYGLETYISSRAMVASEVKLGEKCIIAAGCVIEPFASIAYDTIKWSGSLLAHHSTVGNHCFFGPRATVCGRVTIEDYSFLGANCTIRDHARISSKSLIGAGTVIQAYTEASGVYAQSATLSRDQRSSEIEL